MEIIFSFVILVFLGIKEILFVLCKYSLERKKQINTVMNSCLPGRSSSDRSEKRTAVKEERKAQEATTAGAEVTNLCIRVAEHRLT